MNLNFEAIKGLWIELVTTCRRNIRGFGAVAGTVSVDTELGSSHCNIQLAIFKFGINKIGVRFKCFFAGLKVC